MSEAPTWVAGPPNPTDAPDNKPISGKKVLPIAMRNDTSLERSS